MKDSYKRMQLLWKDDKFRLYVAQQKRQLQLEEYDDKIKQLEDAKDALQSSVVQAFTYKEGKTVKVLRQNLNWSEDNVAKMIKEYEKTHTKIPHASSRSILRFLSELISS